MVTMNSQKLFRRSRIHLALWYALIMGAILSLSGLGMYRSLVQANWDAMEREMESIAGTLHDSLEPMLPNSGDPTETLRRILPELCLAQRPCNTNPTLIQRHTTGISDRSIYYIRLFDHHGKLLAFSPNQIASPPTPIGPSPWETFDGQNGTRYRQFTTILHGPHSHYQAPKSHHDASSWGYLQLGRNLAALDAETQRIQWTLLICFLLALLLVAIASWWLSGLAMGPIYQSYQQQQQFTANAAHELRSPLASLLATVEAILRVPQSNPQDMRAMLHTVERQGRRLSYLITDLLLLTSLEQQSSEQHFQICCLNDLIHDLTEEFLELAIAANVSLLHDISHQKIYVSGRESQLYRLLSNLIANGIQYTPQGGQVLVSLTARDHRAIVTVDDTGIGIAAAEQPRIFDRFYRIDSDRSRKTGGTGLGLAIAQAIASNHQARIKVSSQLNRGSKFTVELPTIVPT